MKMTKRIPSRRVLPASIGTAIIAVLLLDGCAKRDPVAGLSELPRESAASLRNVPNSRLLATQIQQTDPPLPAGSQPVGLCPQNQSKTFFDAQITTPITLCTSAETRTSLESAMFTIGSATTTFKLTNSDVFADLDDAVVSRPPFVCTIRNGPWSARITVDRGCVGTCAPLNVLIVVGVPNSVHYAWYGPFENHPPGFEFVGTPTQTSKIDLGPCHGGVPDGPPLRP
jgi:hypothetical protein